MYPYQNNTFYPGPYTTTYPYIPAQTPISASPQNIQRGLNGMIIQSADNITADSVPMDGSIAVFPKQDLSEIYVKNWNSDGTIRTLVFKPDVQEQVSENSANDISNLLDEKFTEITNKLNRLESSIGKLKTRNYRKENGSV